MEAATGFASATVGYNSLGCGCAAAELSHSAAPKKMATEAEIREEAKRVRRLQIVVDMVTSVLWQSDQTIEEALELVAATKQYALTLFPDKEETYDLIYQPRFRRLLAEKFRII
jgi:hypothetical protein